MAMLQRSQAVVTYFKVIKATVKMGRTAQKWDPTNTSTRRSV